MKLNRTVSRFFQNKTSNFIDVGFDYTLISFIIWLNPSLASAAAHQRAVNRDESCGGILSVRHKAAQNRWNRKLLHVYCGGLFSLCGGTNSSRLSTEICSCADSKTNSRSAGDLEDAVICRMCQTRVITSDSRTGSTAFSVECVWNRNRLKTNKQTSEQVPTETREKSLKPEPEHHARYKEARDGHVWAKVLFIFSFQSLFLQVHDPERLGSVREQIVIWLKNNFVTFLTSVSISQLL